MSPDRVDVVGEVELNGSSVHRLATVATVRSYDRQTVESARNHCVYSVHRLATVATVRSYGRQTSECTGKRYVHSAPPNPGPVGNIVAATPGFHVIRGCLIVLCRERLRVSLHDCGGASDVRKTPSALITYISFIPFWR